MTERFRTWLQRVTLPRFAQNVVLLAGSSALAQGAILLASPVLARLYDPSDFGAFAIYLSVLSIVNAVSSLRFEFAIPLPRDEQRATHLVWVALLSVVLFSLAAFGVLTGMGGWLFRTVDAAELASLYWIIPLSILAMGVFKVMSYWKIRTQRFKDTAVSRSSQGTITALSQVGLGIVAGGAQGLLVGHLAGYAVGSVLLAVSSLREQVQTGARFAWRELTEAAESAKRFPLFSSWAAVFNVASSQVPVLLLASLFGATVTGLYAMAQRVLQTPISTVAQAIAQAFLGDAGTLDRGELATRTWSIFDVLLTVGLPVAAFGVLVAPDLFEVVLGPEWAQSGVYAQVLTPWLLLVFVGSPLSVIPSIVDLQVHEMVFQFALLVLRVAAIIIGGVLQSAELAITLFAGSGAICWFVFVVWILYALGIDIKETLGQIGRRSGRVAIGFVPWFVAVLLGVGHWLVLLAAGVGLGYGLSRGVKLYHRLMKEDTYANALAS